MSERDAAESQALEACSCKVGTSLATWGREDLAAALADRRAAGASLRDLEATVNRAILRSAVDRSNASVLGDVERVYDVLVDDDVTTGLRTEVRARLTDAGVDVDAVTDDFVSYGTIRTHLRECLGADTDRQSTLTREDARGTIEWARARSEGVIQRTIERLASAEDVAIGDVETSHVVYISCSTCGESLPVGEFLDQGGCECPSE